ncbi:MAG: carbohydrate porin [Myxococcales bacterium]|nr:carbohydrate porin [Myxococcales bacterium]
MMGRCLAIAVLVLATAAPARADQDPCACSPNRPGFFRQDALTGLWGGRREAMRDAGFTALLTYAGEVFTSSNLAKQATVAGLGVLALDADLSKLVSDHLGLAHVTGLGIHGDGLSDQLMDIYGVSNNVAPNGVRLFEAWLEQPVKMVTVRAGLLAADQEFILAKHGTALLNATFGIISQLPVNVPGPVYPVATPGVSVRAELPHALVRGAIYDGDQENNHGIPTGLGDDAFMIGEVELEETLKLGGWHHTDHRNGVYAIADRQFDRYVGGFTRVGYSPGQAVELYIDTGLRIGPGPLRERDFASVGLAFARTDVGAQTAIEATYQLQLGWMTIQPDFQLLLLRERTAAVLATRVVIVL